VQVTGGPNSRRSLEFEHGGNDDNGLEWFFAGNLFRDSGWRTNSPSDVRQLFGKLGWQDARTDLDLTIAYADNKLNGNGLQENACWSRTTAASTPSRTSPRTARCSSTSPASTA
jgi:outer membrane receptor for Fe3+-dicitrate